VLICLEWPFGCHGLNGGNVPAHVLGAGFVFSFIELLCDLAERLEQKRSVFFLFAQILTSFGGSVYHVVTSPKRELRFRVFGPAHDVKLTPFESSPGSPAAAPVCCQKIAVHGLCFGFRHSKQGTAECSIRARFQLHNAVVQIIGSRFGV